MAAHDEKKATADLVADQREDVWEDGKVAPARDYSGALVEIDPIEKSLVKKLDWRIMVCDHLLIKLDSN